jgi:dynein heavy chain, axonemal
MTRIFDKIVDAHVRDLGIMRSDSAKVLKELVQASISVFQFVKTNLRPTPAKSHYLFNMRDVSRVVQGLQMMRVFTFGSSAKLVRLWVHENARVFSDRLSETEDRDKLFYHLSVACREFLREDLFIHLKGYLPEEVLLNGTQSNPEKDLKMMTETVRFSDLLDGNGDAATRNYDEIDYN